MTKKLKIPENIKIRYYRTSIKVILASSILSFLLGLLLHSHAVSLVCSEGQVTPAIAMILSMNFYVGYEAFLCRISLHFTPLFIRISHFQEFLSDTQEEKFDMNPISVCSSNFAFSLATYSWNFTFLTLDYLQASFKDST